MYPGRSASSVYHTTHKSLVPKTDNPKTTNLHLQEQKRLEAHKEMCSETVENWGGNGKLKLFQHQKSTNTSVSIPRQLVYKLQN